VADPKAVVVWAVVGKGADVNRDWLMGCEMPGCQVQET